MIVQNAVENATPGPDLSESVGWLIDLIGPKGVLVLLAVGALLLLKALGRDARRAALRGVNRAVARLMRATVRYVRVTLWALRMRMPVRLANRLQPDRWRQMCEDRQLVGLKRGRIKRTPMGVDVRVSLGKKLTLETVVARISALETGLGTRRGAIRVESTDLAHKAIVRITVRDPLARPVKWLAPKTRTITEPAALSMNAFGEWTEVDLQQRILVVGASGSGKSSVQRVLSAPVILAPDAELEVWDLKQGTESQHYEGKADVRITTAEAAKSRLAWYMQRELPRRAAVMQKLRTSTWPTSPQNPDRVVMVDEGAAMVREFDEDELALFFTFLEQARAFGIYLWWATQFPKGTNLPTELRSQMSAIIALKMRRMSESRVVFEDLTKEGWTPHRLKGKGWLMLQDDDHDEPQESRAAWLDEKTFRQLGTEPVSALAPTEAPAPAVPPMPAYEPEVRPKVSLVKQRPAPEEAEPVREVPVPDAILTALAETGSAGSSATQLQLTTGRGKSQVYAALQQLQDDGQVVRIGRGRYALAAEEASA